MEAPPPSPAPSSSPPPPPPHSHRPNADAHSGGGGGDGDGDGDGEGQRQRQRQRRKERPSLAAFLASDAAHEYLLLAKLFLAAYAPYLLPPALLLPAILLPYCCCCIAPEAMAAAAVLALPTLALLLCCYYSSSAGLGSPAPIYLLDFASYKPRDEQKLSTQHCAAITKASGRFTAGNMMFQLKVLLKSGLGDEVYGPPFLFREPVGEASMEAAIGETDEMMFGAVDEVLAKTGIEPAQIDVLVVNVSMFYPSPSLSARIVSRYGMREDVRSFNVSGMGCAAGMVAVDMAKDLLRARRRGRGGGGRRSSYALVVGTENITLNWYYGNDKSMLVPNCLFRCGSYALLLSSRSADRRCAKMQLLALTRTTTAASDSSYNVIFTREDEDGVMGTSLSVDLLKVASRAVTITMAKLVPEFMPLSELLKAAADALLRLLLAQRSSKQQQQQQQKKKPYLPDFKKAFTHFCLHPGGKAVVDGIAKSLSLDEYDLEPAKMTLHRFGNTSSSGLWYAAAYCEAKRRLKRGDRLLQLALGSGFKCNAAVWKILRDIHPVPGCNPWLDCIDRYPLPVPDSITPSHKHYQFFKQMEEEFSTMVSS